MRNRSLYIYILVSSFVMSISHNGWMTLINNYAFTAFQFSGQEIGFLQSVREIPGLLAFTIVVPLLFLSEVSLSMVAVFLLGIGVFFSGYFPSLVGLYFSTVLMSIGYHYFETLNKSLVLQNTTNQTSGIYLGKVVAISSIGSLITYSAIFAFSKQLGFSEQFIFMICGGLTMVVAIGCIIFRGKVQTEESFQVKKLFLKKRYTLFYLLNFFAGARRQIFVVFGGFLMIEKFGYEVHEIAALFFVNQILNSYFAPKIGLLINRFGERTILSCEYVGLVLIFLLYAHVENFYFAAALYLLDNLFFLMAIGINSYFKKVAEPQDIAGSMSVSFTINHVMAVFIPVLYGYIWLQISYQIVFYSAAALAAGSLIITQFIRIPKATEQEAKEGRLFSRNSPEA